MNEENTSPIQQYLDPDRPSPLQTVLDPDGNLPGGAKLIPDSSNPTPRAKEFLQSIASLLDDGDRPEVEVPVAGKYAALADNTRGTLMATDIAMSGLDPHADLVAIPSLVPPNEFKLVGRTVLPRLFNLVIVNATVNFDCLADSETVRVHDKDGVHDIPIVRNPYQ